MALWIFSYIFIIILVINFISVFSSYFSLFNLSFVSFLNCLNSTYFLKSIYFYSIFYNLFFQGEESTKDNKLLVAQRRTSGKEVGLFTCKSRSHLQQLSGSINLLPTSLCYTTHQMLFTPQLTLPLRNISYYMCNCAQCWNNHCFLSTGG